MPFLRFGKRGELENVIEYPAISANRHFPFEGELVIAPAANAELLTNRREILIKRGIHIRRFHGKKVLSARYATPTATPCSAYALKG